MSNLYEKHWITLKRVLIYLQSKQELGFFYLKIERQLTLSAWTDTRWEEDFDNSKSTNSYIILM